MELDHERAWRILAEAWARAAEDAEPPDDAVLAELLSLGRTIGLRYATVTQTLAKASEPKFDALSLERARSLSERVVVRFEQAVCPMAFGGSTYPYGSSSLRNRIRVDEKLEGRIKSEQPYWEMLCRYLDELNDGHREAATSLTQALWYLHRDWARHQTFRNAPPPTSLPRLEVIRAVHQFVAESKTYGRRLETVVAAVYEALVDIGELTSATFTHVNAADASTGVPADGVVQFKSGEVMAVEVKHRPIHAGDVANTAYKCRTIEVALSEFVVDATPCALAEDAASVDRLIAALDSEGLVVTVVPFATFLAHGLSRRTVRVAFLHAMSQSVDPRDFSAWADCLGLRRAALTEPRPSGVGPTPLPSSVVSLRPT